MQRHIANTITKPTLQPFRNALILYPLDRLTQWRKPNQTTDSIAAITVLYIVTTLTYLRPTSPEYTKKGYEEDTTGDYNSIGCRLYSQQPSDGYIEHHDAYPDDNESDPDHYENQIGVVCTPKEPL